LVFGSLFHLCLPLTLLSQESSQGSGPCHLVVDRSVPVERLHASGYWKRTLTDEGWREAKADWNAQVESET